MGEEPRAGARHLAVRVSAKSTPGGDGYGKDSPFTMLADIPEVGGGIGMGKQGEDPTGSRGWPEMRVRIDAWLHDPVGIEALLSRTTHDVVGTGSPVAAPMGTTLMPELLARMLAANGIDPRAFGFMAACRHGTWRMRLGGVRTHIEAERVGTREGQPTCLVSALLHPDGMGMIDTKDGGVVLYEDVPQTILALCKGRPLRDVVSHPVLDPYDLRITGSSDWVGTTMHYAADLVALENITVTREVDDASQI